MQSFRQDLRRAWRKLVRRILHPGIHPEQGRLDDLLYLAGRTMLFRDLLEAVPRQICQALKLDHFDLFLREDAYYVQQRMDAGLSPARFRNSSALVSHLKRERKVVRVEGAEPDAWLMLTPDEEVRHLHAIGAQWLLPMHGRAGLVGFAAFSRQAPATLNRSETRLLNSIAPQVGAGLEAAQFQQSLQREAARRERVERSLELAREVQERLLPQEMPGTALLQVAAYYRSAEEVGGDYYDAFVTPSGKICYVIADVSGKGIAAALLMATLRASLRSLMLGEPSLPELLQALNRQLYEASSASRYATFAMLLYDPASDTLVSSNAGHNPPLLLSGGQVRRLQCGGPVLGLLPVATFEQERVDLHPGDLLLLYTDGVTEAEDRDENELGEDRLIAAAEQSLSQDARGAVSEVLKVVTSFVGNAPQRDDLTLVVLRRMRSANA